jgi:probable HAF family extracellular repeat protein
MRHCTRYLALSAAMYCLLFGGTAHAQSPVLFTDRAQWQAAAGAVASIDFADIAPFGGWSAFDTTSGLTQQGVRFIGISPENPSQTFYLRVVDPHFFSGHFDWGSGPVLHGPPVVPGPGGEGGPGSHIRVLLPPGVTAVAADVMSFLDFASPISVVVTTTAGSTEFVVDSLFHPNRQFVGFTSVWPITSLTFSAADGSPMLDNVRFGVKQRNRATDDRPDDVAGPQVHALYVVPSDRPDAQLDTTGAIETSLTAVQAWLREQTGGQSLQLDTYHGRLDVTFVELPVTDAAIRSYGAFARWAIEDALQQAGLIVPDKIYAVYYGGGSDLSCGSAPWPPVVTGQVVAMYLHGTPPGAPPCDTHVLGASPLTMGYLEFGMLHELIHSFGLVAPCAPHHTLAGHVSDDPRDLMYAGPLPWVPSILDVGRDDYFGHANAACPDDLQGSPYLGPRRSAQALLVTPDRGSGATRTFTLLYSDSQGAMDLTSARVRFSTSSTGGAGTCTASYTPSTDQVSLLNDAGSGWQTGTPGAGTLQNSQCLIDLASSTATISGDDLILTLTVTFSHTFIGARNIYMLAQSGGTKTGWQQQGTWKVPQVLKARSVTPSGGSGFVQSFTLVYSDLHGVTSNLRGARVLFRGAIGPQCLIDYNAITNLVRIQDDADNWGPFTAFGAGTIANSQCTVDLASSTATPSGTTLTLVLNITFSFSFDGSKNVYLRAVDISGQGLEWVQRGTWTVPSVVSVSPNSGSGHARAFAMRYSAPFGAGDLTQAQVRLGATNVARATCTARFTPGSAAIELLDDLGTTWLPGTLGSGTLANSQCTLNLSNSGATVEGGDLVLELKMAFSSTFIGPKNIYMLALNADESTGWIVKGTWRPTLDPNATGPIDLGSLGGGTSEPRAINAAGQIVGTSRQIVGVELPVWRPFIWTPTTGMVDMGTLFFQPGNSLGDSGSAVDINDAGQAVGFSLVGSASPERHAFLWTQSGGMVDLGTLMDSSSTARAVNANGQVVGSSFTFADQVIRSRAFSWTQAGGMVALPTLGGSFNSASAVSDNGLVVGSSSTPNNLHHAVLWTPSGELVDLGVLGGIGTGATAVNDSGMVIGDNFRVFALPEIPGAPIIEFPRGFVWTEASGMVDLGTLGGNFTLPRALNQNGVVVGQSQNSAQNYHAFVWTPGDGMVDLGTLGGNDSAALAVNASGHVVGWSHVADGSTHAFLWTAATGMIDLGTLDGSFSEAVAINDHCQIVGSSRTPKGDRHLVLWNTGSCAP